MTTTEQEWTDRLANDRKRLAALRADMAAKNGTEVEIAHRHGFGTRRDFARIVADAVAKHNAARLQ